MASITARKKIVKEPGHEVEELEEQVAQVRIDASVDSGWHQGGDMK